jgi:hypothetical protein
MAWNIRSIVLTGAAVLAAAAFAQQYPPQPQPYPAQQYPQQGYPGPVMPPQQLDPLVQRIALYPDPLLAQVMTASTFYNQIPDAAAWANQHNYLQGPALAQAIAADQLPWDPSVLALLPFPSVLNMMASDPGWTQALGNAVLTEGPAVMDAIQRQRQIAWNYGYLRSNNYDRVIVEPGAIQILPLSPGLLYVPAYDPYVVFARPARGFAVGAAIRFGPGITIGAAFAPFGWVSAGLGWHAHSIVIDGQPWARTWVNRQQYVHPYAHPFRPQGPRVERHDLHDRGRGRGPRINA